ncbi:hypothetical protein [Sedimenticola selenatireducens]|uniref:terminase small subunit-like protein n=1 Tax=Sedimenticola selenatireducens TaxID=191960 RepID=UPI00048CF2B7|nr:hypothetical protein [Sedimenticola selenatireducens]
MESSSTQQPWQPGQPGNPTTTQQPGTPFANNPTPCTPATAKAPLPPVNLPPDLPAWLAPRPKFNRDDLAELLGYLRNGKSLTAFCRDRTLDPGALRQWIHDDAERLTLYRDAQALGAELIEDQIMDISDGTDQPNGIPNDIQRDALRVNTRKHLLEVWNRDRYGSRAKVEVGLSIDLGPLIQEARYRVERSKGRTYDGEVLTDGT